MILRQTILILLFLLGFSALCGLGVWQLKRAELKTERYALFQETKKAINEYGIHHLEWPVQELDLIKLKLKYPRFKHLIGRSPDKTQYSTGVRVLAYSKEIKKCL